MIHRAAVAMLLYLSVILPCMNGTEPIPQTKRTALEMMEHNNPLREHWIRRIFAAIIDFIVVVVAAIIIGMMLKVGLGPFSGMLNALLALLWVFYAAVMEWLYGATLGKMAMNLKVQSLAGPLDLYKTLLRNLSKVYGLILLVDTIIGMATEGDPRQRFMDRIAETTVITTPHSRSPSVPETQNSENESADIPLPQPAEQSQ